MHSIKLFSVWIGLLIIWEYPADDLRESKSWPAELAVSFFYQFELQALKSLETIEQIGSLKK